MQEVRAGSGATGCRTDLISLRILRSFARFHCSNGLSNLAGKRMNKTFCEFFAGIGLVREGLAGSGWSCVFANDLDPKKHELYEGKFGQELSFHLGDVWNADQILARMPDQSFLATASFPCTDLSLAGKGRGFDGDHSSSFFGFVHILERSEKPNPSWSCSRT